MPNGKAAVRQAVLELLANNNAGGGGGVYDGRKIEKRVEAMENKRAKYKVSEALQKFLDTGGRNLTLPRLVRIKKVLFNQL